MRIVNEIECSLFDCTPRTTVWFREMGQLKRVITFELLERALIRADFSPVFDKRKLIKIKSKYSRCFWHPSTFSGQSQECMFSLYNSPPMHSCSVAVPFQQVQYRVHEVSWPNMPYSQSQWSRDMGPSAERITKKNKNKRIKDAWSIAGQALVDDVFTSS